MKIVHIINPFQSHPSSDLFFAQEVTFETIRKAKNAAINRVDVDVCCVTYPEDAHVIPSDFIPIPFLKEAVTDKATFKQPRKLPLIAEILHLAIQYREANFYIYSNIDISLYPDFYLQIVKWLSNGYDTLIINRRRIPALYNSLNDLDLILMQHGKSHPGFDCFVFHQSLFPKFYFADVCIGVPFFEITFSQNLFAYSNKFLWLRDGNQTFHIGMEIFKRRQPKEYIQYNRAQYYRVIDKIWPDMSIHKIPFSEESLFVRFLKWGLHPCFPIRLMMMLQLKDWGIYHRK
jgi:hypothetical protein